MSNEMTKPNPGLDLSRGSGIPGFDDIPFEDLPIPSIKLVGENTKDKSLADGTEAQNGVFIHTGKRTAFSTFTFRPLSGSKGSVLKYDKPDVPENYVPEYRIIAIDESDNEPFLLRLQSSNLNSFRKVLGEMKRLANKGQMPYTLKVTATVQKLQDDKFKWNAMNFTWEVSDLSEEQKELLNQAFGRYGNASEQAEKTEDFDDDAINNMGKKDSEEDGQIKPPF